MGRLEPLNSRKSSSHLTNAFSQERTQSFEPERERALSFLPETFLLGRPDPNHNKDAAPDPDFGFTCQAAPGNRVLMVAPSDLPCFSQSLTQTMIETLTMTEPCSTDQTKNI